jgi:hypothetical protein
MSKVPYVAPIEDSRLRKDRQFPLAGVQPLIRRTPDGQNERFYCVSCAHPGAFVTIDMPGVIYICDAMSSCGCNCAAKGVYPTPSLAI